MSRAAALLLATVAIVVGAVAAWRTLSRAPDPPDGPVVARIGDATLAIAPGYLRPDDRSGGPRDHLDLVATFPDFAPGGDAAAAPAPPPLVFIRVEPADALLAPEERFAKLYGRFLEPDQWTHPSGLATRRFVDGSPYEGEELYFVAPEGRLFAARCPRPRQPPREPAEPCLQDIGVKGLTARLRFSPDLLSSWERIVTGARALVEQAAR